MAKTISVLGTEYSIGYQSESHNEILKDANGYCDVTSKRIVILSEQRINDDVDNFQYLQNKTLRHEIVHAFIFESGLFSSTYCVDGGWAKNEEMVDWFAIQSPKIFKVFQDLDIL